MHRTDDTYEVELIDLGSVIEETRGNALGFGDSIQGMQRQTGIGFDDD